MAKLCVAIRSMVLAFGHVTTGERVYRQVGDLEGKEAAFSGEDERLCWAMSKTVNQA